jgi:hypothetical protein
MSSPTLDRSNFSFVAETVTQAESLGSGHKGESVLLTARAIVAVTLLGAGFWYMMWKLAVHFWLGR